MPASQLRYEERYEHVKQLGNWVGSLLSYKEYLVYVYNWTWFEVHLSLRNKHDDKMRKHGDRLNAQEALFEFREELQDL